MRFLWIFVRVGAKFAANIFSSFSANPAVFNQGEEGTSWYIIQKGSVNVVIYGKVCVPGWISSLSVPRFWHTSLLLFF